MTTDKILQNWIKTKIFRYTKLVEKYNNTRVHGIALNHFKGKLSAYEEILEFIKNN